MKKSVVFGMLLSSTILLSACQLLGQVKDKITNESDKVEETSSVKKNNSTEKSSETDTTEDFETHQSTLLEIIHAESSQGKITEKKQIPAAVNGIQEVDVAGNEIISYNTYHVPSEWEFITSEGTDAERKPAYLIRNEEDGFGVFELFMLDSYDESPLDGGISMNHEEILAGLEQVGYQFQSIETVVMDGQTWYVGIELYDQNARLIFFRKEDTGSFRDSLILARFTFFRPNLEKMTPEMLEAYKLSVGEVKEVLINIKSEEPQN